LQIENEFYAGIRPKRVAKAGEHPALAKYGVEHIEMRLFDLNPFVDIGIVPEQSTFADILLLMCLFRQSPPITAREQGENDQNKARFVNRGRQPDLSLLVHNREQPFRPIAHAIGAGSGDSEGAQELLQVRHGAGAETLGQLADPAAGRGDFGKT